jgi:hypothetical protein
MRSLPISLGIILLTICDVSAQERISVTGITKAKIYSRIIQNAAEARLIDGEFDPVTAGLLDGLQKNLEDDLETGPTGDRGLALMLYNNLGWMIHYRIDDYPEPLRTEIMQWHLDCTHQINVALRRGVVPKYGGACEFTEAKFKKLHR